MEKNNKKTISAWCLYDWANSVYSLTITTAIFPIYYEAVTTKEKAVSTQFLGMDFYGVDKNTMVDFFGFQVPNTPLYSYSLSFSFLVVVLLSPMLSGIADYTGKKKRFMQFFCLMGSIACMSMYFFTGDHVELGIIASVFASIGYAGSLVFYNSFLPDIVSKDRMDSVSARGFAMGYIGGVLLLILNLAMFLGYETFGFSSGDAAARFSFLTVGIWWLGFGFYSMYYLRDRASNNKLSGKVLGRGFHELKKVFASLRNLPVLRRFLLSFFFYSIGVQTTMYLATLFGSKELHLSTESLIITVLLLQLLAIAGAFAFAKVSEKKGNRFAITIMLMVWIVICITAYLIQNELQFYCLGALVGTVMGGIQSLSRSTYSKILPKDTPDSASYFSFYDVTEKFATVLGTFVYAFLEHLTGSMRLSTLVLCSFFILGIFIINTLKKKDLSPTE